ncbi:MULTISPECIES: benzoate/H(+) symporter BenE family transporter [Micrococcaceae]|uniref:benzoate/H(+) symporter BenE family transporter n=1 Tax=Micrococcaceae TaxID=1268 RepID=UPI00161A9E63|nr:MULTISPECIES: benzoate/H(+) symporter BenE family transporter [Micrococcaceae]MBB5748784.1 benzoate membrane transport protein [Micrococcus sp. TA1]HRO29055.1 benzoate/H(+) symporter BenE family transporter [Citricoccus sp.]HRO93411.1 benzoate/H(+) symporter BenE family transporter [Citricoccus sp.]
MTTTEDPPQAAAPGREPLFERPGGRPVGPRRAWRDLGPEYAANGLVGVVFSASGPIAVTLAVGLAGGLTQAELASWVFGIFLSAGLATIVMSLVYRQPLGFAWSIPGTVLLGPSLQHLSFAEVVGAFFGCGVLVLALGMTGLVRRVMTAIPMPIIMAMVAAVFLRFGTDIVDATRDNAAVAAPMVIAYLVLAAVPVLGRVLPPVLGTLLVGVAAVVLSGQFDLRGDGPVLAAPVITVPEFTWAAQLELVVPLAITVLFVQNGQGIAVLRAAGHRPPITSFAVASGVFSLVNAVFGAVSACVTGPTNALLTASGQRHRQYTAALVYAVLSLACALLAPGLVRFMLATPEAFVLALGGIAMLRALLQAFVTAFSTTFTMGALVTFVVTISGLDLFTLHSAFWGIVIGFAVSRLLERGDHAALRAGAEAGPDAPDAVPAARA